MQKDAQNLMKKCQKQFKKLPKNPFNFSVAASDRLLRHFLQSLEATDGVERDRVLRHGRLSDGQLVRPSDFDVQAAGEG